MPIFFLAKMDIFKYCSVPKHTNKISETIKIREHSLNINLRTINKKIQTIFWEYINNNS